MTLSLKQLGVAIYSGLLIGLSFWVAQTKQQSRILSSENSFEGAESKNWGLNKEGVNAYSAWKISRSSDKVLVAIIDTGVDVNHPDLKNNLWKNPKESGTYRGFKANKISLIPTDKDTVGKLYNKSTDSIDNNKNGIVDEKEEVGQYRGYKGESYISLESTLEDSVGQLYDRSSDGIDNDNNGFVDDVSGWDFYEEANISYDFHGHGTHIAGIVAGKINLDQGVGGVAPNAVFSSYRYYVDGMQYYNKVDKVYEKNCKNEEDSLKIVKIFEESISCYGLSKRKISGNEYRKKCSYGRSFECENLEKTLNLGSLNIDKTVKSFELAIKHGAKIINYSGGGAGSSPDELKALKIAQEAGVLVIVAAGNERQNSDLPFNAYYPCAYKLSNIICVGAVNESIEKNEHSNWGLKSVHISAPGKDILSTVPESMGYYQKMTGTSQSTAFVSGTVALLIAKYPDLKADQIKEILMKSSRKVKTLEKFNMVSGVVDAENSLLYAMKLHNALAQQNNREIARDKNKK